MTREAKITLGVVVVLFVVAVGYFAAYNPTTDLRAQCTDKFNSLDSVQDDNQLELREFMAYVDRLGAEPSTQDFAGADMDNSQTLSNQEFCSFVGTATERG